MHSSSRHSQSAKKSAPIEPHRKRQINSLLSVLLLDIFAMLHGCATQTRSLTHEQIHAVLSAPDRAETDKANDTRRSAAALLRFIDPRPGMQVLELGASGGYTLELMAHAVSATGRVYAQNQGTFMKTVVKDRFAQRLQAYPGRNL
jgi:predicted methyltransferase